jgi:hypothetical protein
MDNVYTNRLIIFTTFFVLLVILLVYNATHKNITYDKPIKSKNEMNIESKIPYNELIKPIIFTTNLYHQTATDETLISQSQLLYISVIIIRDKLNTNNLKKLGLKIIKPPTIRTLFDIIMIPPGKMMKVYEGNNTKNYKLYNSGVYSGNIINKARMLWIGFIERQYDVPDNIEF